MSTPDIQYFPASGTWVKPAGAVRVDYLVCGAGAGGSVGIGEIGRDGEAGALRCGSVDAAELPDTMEVEIGRGGRGAVLGPFKGGDGADGYALIVTHLSGEPAAEVQEHPGTVTIPRGDFSVLLAAAAAVTGSEPVPELLRPFVAEVLARYKVRLEVTP